MGFFHSDDEKRTSRANSVSQELLASNANYFKKLGCKACPLDKANLLSPKMKPVGSKYPDLYVLGECPGKKEDIAGEPFANSAGELLSNLFPDDLRVRWNNSIRCRPTDNAGTRQPSNIELVCCADKQFEDIVECEVTVVLALGKTALFLLTGVDDLNIARGRAFACNIQGQAVWVVPTFHPLQLILAQQMEDNRRGATQMEELFKRDIDLALSYIERDLPPIVKEDKVNKGIELLFQVKDIVQALDEMAEEEATAFDLETVNLRPYYSNSKILTAAISSGKRTIAFPIMHRGSRFTEGQIKSVKEAFKRYLTSGNTKIAHTLSFDLEWVLHEFGIDIAYTSYFEDTMTQAYIIDERARGALKLDFLCNLYFGLPIKKLSNINVNNLAETDLEEVLKYNAFDAKYTLYLWLEQNQVLSDEGLLDVYLMQVGRIPALVIAQVLGIVPDQKYAEAQYKVNKTKLEALERKINSDEDVRRYIKRGSTLNPASNPSLGKFLVEFLGYNECRSGNGGYRVGEEILRDIKHPVAQAVLEMRAVSKLMSTYIVPYFGSNAKHIYPDGLIHTNFNHAVTRTGRLSSDDPNMQNFPKRKGVEARNVVVAPKGKFIVSIDEGQIEARVIGMASKDEVLCNALWHDYDIHMEWAVKIANEYPHLVDDKLDDQKQMKIFRADVKNKWVFPLFFGSAQRSVERDLGLEEGDLTELYEEFWEIFHGVLDWQQTLIEFYYKNGYVETLTGKRRHAPLSKNELINAPIQGTASDIVVNAMERISKYAIKNKRHDLHPVLNVHDDLTFYLSEETLENDIEFIAEQMVTCPFSFVNVPLTVEVAVGRSWGEMEDVGVFKSTDFAAKVKEGRDKDAKLAAAFGLSSNKTTSRSRT